MTNEEARMNLEKLLQIYDDPGIIDFAVIVESIKMALEALEKQIPKKPKYKAEDRFVKNHFTEYSYCPVCEKEVVEGDMFCVMCGQAIDWTEGEG